MHTILEIILMGKKKGGSLKGGPIPCGGGALILGAAEPVRGDKMKNFQTSDI